MKSTRRKNGENKNITQLKSILHHFGEEAAREKERLLDKISSSSLSDAKDIISYYDCLLFLLVHPENKTLFSIAKKELKRVGDTVKEVFNGTNERKKTQLTNTGVANTKLNVSFSFDLVKWLEEKFQNDISIFSCDAEEETIKSVFIFELLRPEANRFKEESCSLAEFIYQLKPKT